MSNEWYERCAAADAAAVRGATPPQQDVTWILVVVVAGATVY